MENETLFICPLKIHQRLQENKHCILSPPKLCFITFSQAGRVHVHMYIHTYCFSWIEYSHVFIDFCLYVNLFHNNRFESVYCEKYLFWNSEVNSHQIANNFFLCHGSPDQYFTLCGSVFYSGYLKLGDICPSVKGWKRDSNLHRESILARFYWCLLAWVLFCCVSKAVTILKIFRFWIRSNLKEFTGQKKNTSEGIHSSNFGKFYSRSTNSGQGDFLKIMWWICIRY